MRRLVRRPLSLFDVDEDQRVGMPTVGVNHITIMKAGNYLISQNSTLIVYNTMSRRLAGSLAVDLRGSSMRVRSTILLWVEVGSDHSAAVRAVRQQQQA